MNSQFSNPGNIPKRMVLGITLPRDEEEVFLPSFVCGVERVLTFTFLLLSFTCVYDAHMCIYACLHVWEHTW